MARVNNTITLTAADVGNVLPVDKLRPGGGRVSAAPAGTYGTMNSRLVMYDRCNTQDGKPIDLDIGEFDTNSYLYPSLPQYKNYKGLGLAGFFKVSPASVRRWFGMPAKRADGTTFPVSPSNCVPVSAVGARVIQLPPWQKLKIPRNLLPGPTPFYRVIPGDQQRVLFAAALAARDYDAGGNVVTRTVRRGSLKPINGKDRSTVEQTESGGLQRHPIWTRGDALGNRGTNNPFLIVEPRDTIAEALTFLWGCYTGDVSRVIEQGWVQLTIEPQATTLGTTWLAKVVLYYYDYDQQSESAEQQIANAVNRGE